MILVDTGPLVALFDPRDGEHERCSAVLKLVHRPVVTTVAVLTEAFHLLPAGTLGAANLRIFIQRGGVSLWFMDSTSLQRCLALMDEYADHPMDLADASLVAAAETLRTRTIFTLDRSDFTTYRLRRGRTVQSFEMLPGPL